MQWYCKAKLDTGHYWDLRVNPLSSNGDENKISLYIITACSNIQVMRIKETITKVKMSR